MRRGQSGKSLLFAVDKPSGVSSHDVVNRARSAFSERRVGHAGTLDPFAEGVLPIMVGPASRLDRYLVGHDKNYVATVSFGKSTTTDDREGETLRSAPPSRELANPGYAQGVLDTMLGSSMQVPPAYSAIKVGGRKACDEARKGNIINLEPREIEVYRAQLLSIDDSKFPDSIEWKVDFDVSKGTYIRALARDVGIRCKVPAHLEALVRTKVGAIGLEDCVPYGALSEESGISLLDPVALLGYRVVFVDEKGAERARNGGMFRLDRVEICSHSGVYRDDACGCIPAYTASTETPSEGELFSVAANDRLCAIYRYDGEKRALVPDCVFQTGVSRGRGV